MPYFSTVADESSSAPLLAQPPPYNIAIDLPSYEEAERTKAEEADRAQQREQERIDNMVFSHNHVFIYNYSGSSSILIGCLTFCVMMSDVVQP